MEIDPTVSTRHSNHFTRGMCKSRFNFQISSNSALSARICCLKELKSTSNYLRFALIALDGGVESQQNRRYRPLRVVSVWSPRKTPNRFDTLLRCLFTKQPAQGGNYSVAVKWQFSPTLWSHLTVWWQTNENSPRRFNEFVGKRFGASRWFWKTHCMRT